jgi:hypothetical protein
MATLVRCPRCKAETDISASRPGSIIKCVHCRGDMRVPDGPKTPAAGGGKMGGGRQSTLFRKMTNATVPGQRGRSSVAPSNERPGTNQGRDLSGVYMGAGIAALIVVVIAIGFVMKGKSTTEPETGRGASETRGVSSPTRRRFPRRCLLPRPRNPRSRPTREKRGRPRRGSPTPPPTPWSR